MSGVGALAGEKYISLTTFKQDGTPVRDRRPRNSAAGVGAGRRRAFFLFR
jgi:hypothetical protein